MLEHRRLATHQPAATRAHREAGTRPPAAPPRSDNALSATREGPRDPREPARTVPQDAGQVVTDPRRKSRGDAGSRNRDDELAAPQHGGKNEVRMHGVIDVFTRTLRRLAQSNTSRLTAGSSVAPTTTHIPSRSAGTNPRSTHVTPDSRIISCMGRPAAGRPPSHAHPPGEAHSISLPPRCLLLRQAQTVRRTSGLQDRGP